MFNSAFNKVSQATAAVTMASLKAVPAYGNIDSAVFVLSLLAETYVRLSYAAHIGTRELENINITKYVQIVAGIDGSGFSWMVKIPAIVSLFFINHDNRSLPRSDRPLLNAQMASAKEFLNMASKIIQSVATGVVVQKWVNGQTEGKARTAVTAALLALSAWNVYNVKIQSKAKL